MSREALQYIFPDLSFITQPIYEQLRTDALYEGYTKRQQADIDSFRRDENLHLPTALDYGSIGGLSNEVRQKLETVRPETLGAASRIPGVTPAAVIALMRHVKKRAA
jgi:tRNA uridine 5-carboxymethylaminomethyl modification enzyme